MMRPFSVCCQQQPSSTSARVPPLQILYSSSKGPLAKHCCTCVILAVYAGIFTGGQAAATALVSGEDDPNCLCCSFLIVYELFDQQRAALRLTRR
jgi:hypothetical protein